MAQSTTLLAIRPAATFIIAI